jgi:hypothetical protein
MPMDVQWRSYGGSDAIVLVDPGSETVSEISRPDEAALRDYLAVTGSLDRWRRSMQWRPLNGEDRDPETFGDLVVSRAESGEITFLDPELFWEGVYRWFRSHGSDYNS